MAVSSNIVCVVGDIDIIERRWVIVSQFIVEWEWLKFGVLPASSMSMQQQIAELFQGAAAKCRRYRRVYEEENWQVGKGAFGKARNETQTQA